MKKQTFQDEIVKPTFKSIENIFDTKGEDYTHNDDQLDNFKRQAKALDTTTLLVWAIYASKHWDAIITYIKTGEVKSEAIEGRILDMIAYLILLLGIIKDEEVNVLQYLNGANHD